MRLILIETCSTFPKTLYSRLFSLGNLSDRITLTTDTIQYLQCIVNLVIPLCNVNCIAMSMSMFMFDMVWLWRELVHVVMGAHNMI